MKTGMIDVIDWQISLNMKTGRQTGPLQPIEKAVSALLNRHPYPGDLQGSGCAWVTDTALDILQWYQPEFMFLGYCDLFFSTVFQPPGAADRKALSDQVFGQIERFKKESGFEVIILGLGNLRPVESTVDMNGLDGWCEAVGMTPQYAGIFSPSEADLRRIRGDSRTCGLFSRDVFCKTFDAVPLFRERCPDYLAYAEDGHYFRALGTTSRPIFRMPAKDRFLPLYISSSESGAASAETILDLKRCVLEDLKSARTALIFTEGIGTEEFPLPFRKIDCTMGSHSYAHGEGHYHTIMTGEHFPRRPYPPAYRAYLDDHGGKPYPFSGYFETIGERSMGAEFSGKSAAVGARSILTHAAAGTDIIVECFARALYNHGVMAVVDREKLGG